MRTAAMVWAAGLLATSTAAPRSQAAGSGVPGATLEVTARSQSETLRGPVLDLALPSEESVLVLTPATIALYHWSARGLMLDSSQELPGPLASVRHPGGLLLPDAAEYSAWVATSAMAQAVLFEIEGARLVERARAAALPWKDAPLGLRYRSGSDWIEGPLPGLGPGPFLALEPALEGIALSTAGELLVASADGVARSGLVAGPALAALWPPFFAAASAEPPQAKDHVLVFEWNGTEVRAGPLLPVVFEGAVRALAARRTAEGARLVVAVEDLSGDSRLERLDLRLAPQP
jgi:hypothetical protein